MKSISGKIQAALIASISVVAVCALGFILVNQWRATRNQQIIDTMIMEYNIISLSDDLIQAYNDDVKNQNDSVLVSRYQTLHDNLLSTLIILKERISSKESIILLQGVDNTVKSVIAECDTGISEIKENNYQTFSDHYAKANKYNEFVKENTRALVEKELKYLYESQKHASLIHSISIGISTLVFLLVILSMLYYARSFSKQLIRPLTDLSVYANSIANGNIKDIENHKLTITNDEVGSVTQSIQTMVGNLVSMMKSQQQITDALQKAAKELEEKNKELQSMNTLMIGRELKMIELKSELAKLKNK